MELKEMNKYEGLALLLIRFGVGIIFIVAGWWKLTGMENAQVFFGSLGIPLPGLMAWVVALVEFFGGLMVLFGSFIRIPALLLAINMVVAIITTKLDGDFYTARLSILLLLTCLGLFFLGSGRLSVDRAMGRTVYPFRSSGDTTELENVSTN